VTKTVPRYRAVIFDLLTALEDSWSLWNSVAGDPERGLAWRREYLRLTYGAGAYRPYESMVAEAAANAGLAADRTARLVERWDELAPWPEAPEVLRTLQRLLPLAAVTNCSEELGRRAAARAGVTFEVLVTAERAGWYKPDPRPYRLALTELGLPAEQALFVAGSPADLPGAAGVGLAVVWHNRLGLPRFDLAVEPLATYASLEPLLEQVLG
jgi:2-haloalkanoic acid dehalogenase type II